MQRIARAALFDRADRPAHLSRSRREPPATALGPEQVLVARARVGPRAGARGFVVGEFGKRPTFEGPARQASEWAQTDAFYPKVAAARQMACDIVHNSDLVDHEADLPHTGDAHDALYRPSVLA
ncbi:hypothetical protein T492DRAFT_880208 [Pavlovales sp. CCMP2436]|nr:hypothetical protein T492DRAFT_880208 [Pavlovales sp. CCMP2436]